MIYEEFKPFLLAACFPCDQHHNRYFSRYLSKETVKNNVSIINMDTEIAL